MFLLVGPVYEIERKHKFSQIGEKLTDLKTLFGPCYDVLHNNKFNEIETHVQELKNLQVRVAMKTIKL